MLSLEGTTALDRSVSKCPAPCTTLAPARGTQRTQYHFLIIFSKYPISCSLNSTSTIILKALKTL